MLIIFDVDNQTLFEIIDYNIRYNKMTSSNFEIRTFNIEFKFDEIFQNYHIMSTIL